MTAVREMAILAAFATERLPTWGDKMNKLLAVVLLACATAFAQDPKAVREGLAKLQWQRGPTQGAVGAQGSIVVPANYSFLDGPNSSKFLELMGNPPRPNNYILTPDSASWFIVFKFEDTGHVKDDEKVDPDAILKSLREGDGPSNERRRSLGMPTLTTEGWQVPPHYDVQTKRLEWGVRLRSGDGADVVNYTSRILGRTGVMSAVLVSDPASLPEDIKAAKPLLANYTFNAGQQYAEYREGDKVAEYGLSALIVGGAAAAAAKSGLLAKFWKVFVALGIGIVAGIGWIWKKVSGKQ